MTTPPEAPAAGLPVPKNRAPSTFCTCNGDRLAADGRNDAILLCHVADVAVGSGRR